MKFSNGSDGGNEDYNKYRGPSDLSLGIMQKRLGEDSYPIVDKGKKESSSYLSQRRKVRARSFILMQITYLNKMQMVTMNMIVLKFMT